MLHQCFLAKDVGTQSSGIVALVIIPPSSREFQVSTILVFIVTWLICFPCAVQCSIWWLCWSIITPNHLALFSLHTKPYPFFLHAHQPNNKSILRFWVNHGELCRQLLAFFLSFIKAWGSSISHVITRLVVYRPMLWTTCRSIPVWEVKDSASHSTRTCDMCYYWGKFSMGWFLNPVTTSFS